MEEKKIIETQKRKDSKTEREEERLMERERVRA